MKYLFLTVCTLLLWQSRLQAQKSNPFQIKRGNLVFFRIYDQKKAPDIYRMQVPFYVVGSVVSLKNSYVKVKPQYYLYACSSSSEKWIKTPKVVVQKQSYERESVRIETWDVSTHLNYSQNIYKIRPCTGEALRILTRDVFAPEGTCPEVISVNQIKTRKP